MSNVPVIFCCYSNKDQEYVDDLYLHLAPHVVDGKIDLVMDRKSPKKGNVFNKWARQQIARSHYALLFLSPHFLTSTVIKNTELPEILAHSSLAKTNNGLMIVPVFVSPSTVESWTTRYSNADGTLEAFCLQDLFGFRDQGNTPEQTLLDIKETGRAPYQGTLVKIAMDVLNWKPPAAQPTLVAPRHPITNVVAPPDPTRVGVVDPETAIDLQILALLPNSTTDVVQGNWIRQTSGPLELRLAAYMTWHRRNGQSVKPDDGTLIDFEMSARRGWTVITESFPPLVAVGVVHLDYPQPFAERLMWSRRVTGLVEETRWCRLSSQLNTLSMLVQDRNPLISDEERMARDIEVTKLNQSNLQLLQNSRVPSDELHTATIRIFQQLIEKTGDKNLALPWADWSYRLAQELKTEVALVDSLTALLEVNRLARNTAAVEIYRSKLGPLIDSLEQSTSFDELKSARKAVQIIIESLGNEGRFRTQLSMIEQAERLTQSLIKNHAVPLKTQIVSLNNQIFKAQAQHGLGRADTALEEYDNIWSKAENFRQQAAKDGDHKALPSAVWEQLVALEGQIRIGIEINDPLVVTGAIQKLDTMLVNNQPDLPPDVSRGLPALLRGMVAEWERRNDDAYKHYHDASLELKNDLVYHNLAASLHTMLTLRLSKNPEETQDHMLVAQIRNICSTGFRREGIRVGLSITRELIKLKRLDQAQLCLELIGNGWADAEIKVDEADVLLWSFLIAKAELAYSRNEFDDAEKTLKPVITFFDGVEWPEFPVVCAEAYQLAGNIARRQYRYSDAVNLFELAAALAVTANIPETAINCHRAASEIYRTTADSLPLMAYLHASSAVVIALDASKESDQKILMDDRWNLNIAEARLTLAMALAEIEATEAFFDQVTRITLECVRVGGESPWRKLYGQTLLAKVAYQYRQQLAVTQDLVNGRKPKRSRSDQELRQLAEELIGETKIGIKECCSVGDLDHAARALPMWARLLTSGFNLRVQSNPSDNSVTLMEELTSYLKEFNPLTSLDSEIQVHLEITAAIVYQSTGDSRNAELHIQKARALANTNPNGKKELLSFVEDSDTFLSVGN